MLSKSTESMILIALFKLWVVWLSPYQWQVVTTSIRSMLYAELAGISSGSIDHLGIIIVPLRIYLMTQVFLIDVLLWVSLTTDGVHHIWACTNMWTVTSFKWFQMRSCSRSNDSFFGVRWAYIIILMSLSAVNPTHRILLLIAQVDLLSRCVWHLLLHLSVALDSLRWSLSPIMLNFLTWIIKRYMNTSVSISYKTITNFRKFW